MDAATHTLWQVRDRLPRALRRVGREASALFLPHTHDCAACADYHARLAQAQRTELRHWYGRSLLLWSTAEPLPAGYAAAAGAVIPTFVDTEVTRGAAGPGEVALIIADRFGRIFDTVRAPEADALPDAGEIEEWFRFLAMQCPECGVPDDPGLGRWAP